MANSEKPGRSSETAVVVYHGEETVDGDPIEPEEQAAEVVQPISTMVTIGNGSMRTDVDMRTMPREIQEMARNKMGHIVHTMSAGELARSAMEKCAHCLYFNHEKWNRLLANVETGGDQLKLVDLNVARSHAAEMFQISDFGDKHVGTDGMDLEHALKSFGICDALTEHMNDLIIVTPMSSCPDDQPYFFKPRKNLEDRRNRVTGHDWIMRRAQGRPQ